MKITKSEFLVSGTRITHFPTDNRPEFVFCGRSNVGKSSFINALMNHTLAHTSSKPGKTQTINYFNINDLLYFVDVPGYGYAAVSKSQKESFGKMIEEYLTQREQLKLALLLVDFRHKPTNDDKIMYDYFKYYNIPVLVVATKKDKVKRSEHEKNKKLIKETLNIIEGDNLVVTSSETRDGLDNVLNIIEQFL